MILSLKGVLQVCRTKQARSCGPIHHHYLSPSLSPSGCCQNCVKSPGDKFPLASPRLQPLTSPSVRLLGRACCFCGQIANRRMFKCLLRGASFLLGGYTGVLPPALSYASQGPPWSLSGTCTSFCLVLLGLFLLSASVGSGEGSFLP